MPLQADPATNLVISIWLFGPIYDMSQYFASSVMFALHPLYLDVRLEAAFPTLLPPCTMNHPMMTTAQNNPNQVLS